MPTLKSQQGIGLVVLFLAIIAAGAVFLLANSGTGNGRIDNENITTTSLASAKSALLAFASTYYLRQLNAGTGSPQPGIHGLLPCPEKNASLGDGLSAGQCASTHESSLGRFPWRSLNIKPLKDGAGECLWYALSGGFFHQPRSPMTNDDTPGMFQIYNQNGVLHMGASPEDRVVALIIAPGLPLSGQSRITADSRLPCRVAHDSVVSTDYLDTYQGINNAFVNESIPDQLEQFIMANALSNNPSINDRILTITADEIFDEIKKQNTLYETKIIDLGIELSNCLINYSITSNDNSNPVTPGSCRADCNADRNLCFLNATSGRERAACNRDRNACRRSCPRGGRGGGTGGGTTSTNTAYQLPWPAPVDLNFADARLDTSYTDLDASSIGTYGYLGRLPYDITNSNSQTGITTTTNTLAEFCGFTVDSESELLWKHWKDHWFYVVGKDYSPGSSQASSTCTACPVYNPDNSKYAAILFFSGERLAGQLRRSNETENPDPLFATSKYTIVNYLEGSNASNYSDNNGDKTYATYTVADTPNDLLFCIPTDMSTVTGTCP